MTWVTEDLSGRRNWQMINLDHVIRIVKEGERLTYHLIDGNRVGVWVSDNYVSSGNMGPIIPALPGYYVLRLYSDGIKKMPIIAWRDAESLNPIELDDTLGESAQYILCPDGTVVSYGQSGMWDTIDEWEKEERPAWEERQKADDDEAA